MVAENMGLTPKSFDLWGWSPPRGGPDDVSWTSRTKVALRQRGPWCITPHAPPPGGEPMPEPDEAG
eukprot:12544421-Prorocentrum_lima.AAC.1